MTRRQDDKMEQELVTVVFTDIAQTGEAIGRVDGVVLFVPFGYPGDRAAVMIIERKRTFARGRLVRLLEASPKRVAPVCPYFTHCGGCEWQHIAYPEQVHRKEQNVRAQLTRIGKLAEPNVLPCLPSPTAYGYRNHARLRQTATGKVGYRAARSHEVVAIDLCPIVEPGLNEELQHLSSSQWPADRDEIELRVAMPIQIGAYSYQVATDVFFQVNTAVAAYLVQEVVRALALQGGEQLLELYCGMGLFTVPLAAQAGYLLGVEANAAATANARENVLRAGLSTQVEFLTMAVELALTHPTIAQRTWGAIVLDPPRAGITQPALTALLNLAAPKIVYVSCDPATLARDAQILCSQGYVLRYAQPLDMFPQTHHVETVALFERA